MLVAGLYFPDRRCTGSYPIKDEMILKKHNVFLAELGKFPDHEYLF
jgi:hypothetical protein